MSDQLRELLRAADPARGVQVGPGDVEAVLDRARDDVTSYAHLTPSRPRAVRLLPVGAAAAAVVVAAGFVATRTVDDSPTPQLPPAAPVVAAPCLTAIADGLTTTAYDGRTGRYEYLRLRTGSSLTTEIPGSTGMATVRYREDISRWLADDGSGRVRVVRSDPTYPDARSREYFTQHPERAPSTGTSTAELRPGEFDRIPLPPADPAVLAETLYQPRENGPSQALVGVADLHRERVLDAAHRAAVLRFLAGTEGVACRGEHTDPAGRTGVAVSANVGRGPQPSPGDLGREYLLFDPRTGELLASTGNATADGPVEWSTLYLDRGRTDELG